MATDPAVRPDASLFTCMISMLVSGALNTLLMKFMVIQQVPTAPGAPSSGFEHPYFQSLLMMLGELLCLVVHYSRTGGRSDVSKAEQAPAWVFGAACALDWTATTLVNMAYVLIAASVVQMTRGAIVVFTCFLSVVFLRRRQHGYHIAGVALVALGITLVSLSALLAPERPGMSAKASQTRMDLRMLGLGLCIGAQVFQASMLVFEEKIMKLYPVPPLQVVGFEGAFGTVFGSILIVGLNMASVEDTPGAIYQMRHSPPLLLAVIGSVFSIAVFNASGVTVTQRASAVARSTIDVSRTIVIWIVELALGWNRFSTLQLVGFVVLALGTALYNRLLVIRWLEPAPEASALAKPRDASDDAA